MSIFRKTSRVIERFKSLIGLRRNLRDIFVPDRTTAAPLRMVIEAVRRHLPTGDFDSYSATDKALAEACVYLEFHRVEQALLILQEAMQASEERKDWIADLIAAIGAAAAFPGTSIDDHKAAMEQGRRERQLETDRFRAMLERLK